MTLSDQRGGALPCGGVVTTTSARAAHGGRAEEESMGKKNDRETIAHHEAGHFVAAYVLGNHERIVAVDVRPSGDAGGQNHGDGSFPLEEDSSRREVESVLIELFAGCAAHLQLRPRETRIARAFAADDDAKAADIIGGLGLSGERLTKREKWLRAKAASLVDEHWLAVSALARELLERETLEGFEAAWVVAVAIGEAAQTALAEYRRQHRGGA